MEQAEGLRLKPLVEEYDLKLRVANLAAEIAQDFKGGDMVVVGLLKGSFVFMADIVRLLYVHNIYPLIDFVTVSSYGASTKSSGRLKLLRDLTTDIAGRSVLLVDDILDTGWTLQFMSQHLKKRRPLMVKTCVLLDKPDCRKVPFKADYVGFTIPNVFVVGYGLDYGDRYRGLPYISAVEFPKDNSTRGT